MSMEAKQIKCEIIENERLTPTVMKIRFMPNKKIKFTPGQFLSIYVPHSDVKLKAHRRAYSFANSPEEAPEEGYELCVKYLPGGKGTEFLNLLKPGDTFRATAPYGDFIYEPPGEGRSICFICTGTGIGPFRSMVKSKAFQENPPENAYCIFGARTQSEVLYRGEFEKAGVETAYCISRPEGITQDDEFKGRVTDYLNRLPKNWKWHKTDFYLCGNAQMIEEVREILIAGHGVAEEAVFNEVFFAAQTPLPEDDGDGEAA